MRAELKDFAEVRAAIAKMCEELADMPAAAVFNCKLVAMELLSNVLQHGGGKAYFSYAVERDVLRISVQGERPFEPPEVSVCPEGLAESGRGLYLVDALTLRREYSEQDGVSVLVLLHE